MRKIRSRPRRAVWLVTVVALFATLPVAGAGLAGAAPDSGKVLLDAAAPPPGVTEREPSPAPAAPIGDTTPMLTLEHDGSSPVAQPDGEVPGGYYCTEKIDHDFDSLGQDEFLEETGGVDYFAQVDCNFYLASIEGIAGVLDRSDSFNNESFNDRVLGTGTYWYSEWDYTGYSLGGVGFRARTYNGARKVEPAFELYLLAPEGLTWGACNPVPGLRYLVCQGLGTDYLHVVMGKGELSTGLTKACRDQRAGVDPEQARLTVTHGGTPASTQIIGRNPTIRNRVVTFKKELCGLTGSGGATTLANTHGLGLWQDAVTAARNGTAAGDDRPLYWARLSMTTAFSQWRPSFGADRTALQLAVDRASRGMTSHAFTTGAARKVFVSGFDPFVLDGGNNILRGNPSAAAVLKLDGDTTGGVEIQAVVFPVRYDDFDGANGLVEQVFAGHVAPGPQQASLITTVSQGDDSFDLEFYNGRRRSSTLPDNRNRQGGGTYDNPSETQVGAGNEFLQTTLPVDRMKITGSFAVDIDTTVHEKVTSTSPSAPRLDGPTLGSIAVRGSGGGYLSNEIAYRVTRLRGAAGTLPVGHVHTPELRVPTSVNDIGFDGERNSIAAQYRQILNAGIAAPAVPPVRVTTDRSTYTVGERPQYSVLGGPDDEIKWTGVLNGTVTGEVDAFYGHRTDAAGTWSGSYHHFAQPGTWTKWVRVDGRLASVTVTVNPATPQPSAPVADFDGDRRTDVSVWRPADGVWHVSPSGGGGPSSVAWGLPGDLPVEADFDGDGRTDRSVFRPSDGTWYLLQSTEGMRITPFGVGGDVPVPSDFDGDRRADLAVWRPGNGTWYVQTSGGSYYTVPFGSPDDRAVPGDYDGDRRTDIAVFRPSTGQWIISRSSDGQVEYLSFGIAEDRPVAADYDGDNRADLAVFRPSTGTWYVWPSDGGSTRIVSWGLGSDVAAPGDFDGDGSADHAVFRPSEGVWYVLLANGGYQYHSFGQSGDIPVPGVNLTR